METTSKYNFGKLKFTVHVLLRFSLMCMQAETSKVLLLVKVSMFTTVS